MPQISRTPLILLPPHPSATLLATAYGLGHAGGTIVCPTDETIAALPTPPQRREHIGGLNDFILRFDTRRNAIDDVTVTHLADAVEVAVTPRDNYIDPRDFLFAPSRAHFDGVILLGVDSPDAHPLWSASLTEALPEAPVATYAATDSVTLAADMLAIWGDDLPSVAAHCLLYAIVTATEGLRGGNTTAATLAVMADLMRHGGELQRIMTTLYKDTPFPFLRLWGAAIGDITVSADGTSAVGILPPGTTTDASMVDAALRHTTQFLPDTGRLFALWHDGTGTAGRSYEDGAAHAIADSAHPDTVARRLLGETAS